MEVEDHVVRVPAMNRDLDGVYAADLRRFVVDIGGHRHLCHHLVERGPHHRDVSAGVELTVTQYCIQLILLLPAHRFSSLGAGCASACGPLISVGSGWRGTTRLPVDPAPHSTRPGNRRPRPVLGDRRDVGYARVSSSTGTVRTPAV